jgi:hypothetical protein
MLPVECGVTWKYESCQSSSEDELNNVKTSKYIIAVVVLAGAALWIFRLQQANQKLRTDAVLLQEKSEEAATLREENQRLSAALQAAAKNSQSERGELMRLRAQSPRVRELEKENESLKAERQRLLALQNRARTPQAPSAEGQSPAEPVKAPLEPPRRTINFGVVELAEAAPTQLDLGEGKQCIVTPTQLPDGNIQLTFNYEGRTPDGTPVTEERTLSFSPGSRVASVINDVEITLQPSLKR